MAGRTKWATAHYDTPQKSVRNPNAIMYVVIHHAATLSLSAVVAMEMGTKQVSSTVVIKDEQVVSMMDEFYRAWSLSSGYWDSVSLSSETCNSGGAESGWPISEASYVSLARVVADWCIRYGIPCNRERIMGHREVYTRYGASYATACPGGIDLDRVVAMANAIINGSEAIAPIRRRFKVASALVFNKDRPAGDGSVYTYNADIPDAPLKQIGGGEFQSIQGLGVDAIGVGVADWQHLMRERGIYDSDKYLRLVKYTEASVDALMKRHKIGDRSAAINYEGFLVFRPN